MKEIFNSIAVYICDVNHIPAIIGILGFVLSVYNLIAGMLSNYRNISISVSGFYVRGPVKDVHIVQIYLTAENKSRLPISISRLFYVDSSKSLHQCALVPQLIYKLNNMSNNIVIESEKTMSLQFPLNIPSLGAISGFVQFRIPKGIFQLSATPQSFQVNTNRGKPLKCEVLLDQAHRLNNGCLFEG